MRRVQKAGLPVVHYFRPILAGLNDAPEILHRALSIADDHADVMCVGGLRVSEEIRRNLLSVGYSPVQRSNDITKPPMDERVMETLFDLQARIGARVRVCVHTTDAVDFILSRESI